MSNQVIGLLLLLSCALLVRGKLVKEIREDGDVVRATAYRSANEVGDHKTPEELDNGYVVRCALYYRHSYREIGWDIIEGQSNPKIQTDAEQARCLGELEGTVTGEAIYTHYYNNIKDWCKGRKATCTKVFHFLGEHLNWLQQEIKDKAAKDPIWHHVEVFYNHILGLYLGYQEQLTNPKKNLTLSDFILMNLQPDLNDVVAAVEKDVSAKVRGDTRCSAIIKLLPDNEDLLVGHNTWTGYVQMYRMLKKYNMPLHTLDKSNEEVPGKIISFSGYPGVISSGDDFYMTSSHLVALETTIGNSDSSRWEYVNSTGQLFDTIRSVVALRLASKGREWCETFSQYNSGTYNNQWMVVDLNRFEKGKKPSAGTLYVLEQIPGYVKYDDQTARLTEQGYWPSYNVPFYPDVFNMSGNQELVDKYGDWFSYDNTPRALIFRRDHSKVKDLDSLLSLLRYNDYKNDPYSKCNCTPPYSAENALAARCDLNPKNGSYPIPALGHRPHGAIDAKVTSSDLAKNITFTAICGPTTGNDLPPFSWSQSDYVDLPHLNQPDSFHHFQPVTWKWRGPFF